MSRAPHYINDFDETSKSTGETSTLPPEHLHTTRNFVLLLELRAEPLNVFSCLQKLRQLAIAKW